MKSKTLYKPELKDISSRIVKNEENGSYSLTTGITLSPHCSNPYEDALSSIEGSKVLDLKILRDGCFLFVIDRFDDIVDAALVAKDYEEVFLKKMNHIANKLNKSQKYT